MMYIVTNDIYLPFFIIQLLCVLIEEDECNLTEYVDVPKVLGDLFESLIGAIYLDSGKSLARVWEIIYSLMHKEIGKKLTRARARACVCVCMCVRAYTQNTKIIIYMIKSRTCNY